jgi:hypothetical protein
MRSFGARLRLIPGAALITGILMSVMLILPIVLGPMRLDPEMVRWPPIAKVALITFAPLSILIYAGLVGFIYADAKRRRMRHVLWAWLAVVPYFIGVILYFILRAPLPTPCRNCGTEVPQAFAFCPGSGASIHPICAQCGKPLQQGWTNCPHCGLRVIQPVVENHS